MSDKTRAYVEAFLSSVIEAAEPETQEDAEQDTKDREAYRVQNEKKTIWRQAYATRTKKNYAWKSDNGLPGGIVQRNNPEAAARMPEVDFDLVMFHAMKLFQDQSLISAQPRNISLKSMETTKAKAESFLDAINNLINVSHLREVISNDGMKFRRKAEMEVMNPLLDSYKVAAVAGKRSLERLVMRLESAMDAVEELEEKEVRAVIRKYGDEKEVASRLLLERMQGSRAGIDNEESHFGNLHNQRFAALEEVALMQRAYGVAIDNLGKVVNGLSRIIQLERISGGRPWGNLKMGQKQIGYVKGLDEGGEGNDDPEDDSLDGETVRPGEIGSVERPREMSSQELFELARKQELEERARKVVL